MGFLEKSRELRMLPKWSLEVPAASKLTLDDPWMLLDAPKMKLKQNHTHTHDHKKWKPLNLANSKDAHDKIIEIGLGEMLST